MIEITPVKCQVQGNGSILELFQPNVNGSLGFFNVWRYNGEINIWVGVPGPQNRPIGKKTLDHYQVFRINKSDFVLVKAVNKKVSEVWLYDNGNPGNWDLITEMSSYYEYSAAEAEWNGKDVPDTFGKSTSEISDEIF